MNTYDVIVIGAGPGGYVAAIRAAQLGLKTACVDRWLTPEGKPALGGTCLNAGCIPSKALLDSSHHYHNLTHLLPAHGIRVGKAEVDLDVMQARKDKVVTLLTAGIRGLFKKNGVTWIPGEAALVPENRVAVTPHGGGEKTVIGASNLIIATGSAPMALPSAPAASSSEVSPIVDSTGALGFRSVPGRLGIIGAGIIGLELGSIWARLGSKVTLLEARDRFLPEVDGDIAKAALKVFEKQGLDIRLGVEVTSTAVADAGKATQEAGSVTVHYRAGDGDREMTVDRLIVARGRRPVTAGLDPAAVGLAVDEQGFIEVDVNCRTNLDGVYAIGDVVRGPMLAHKASEEGIVVAERIAGHASPMDHDPIPGVIYTHPEIAWVGKTEAALEIEGVPYRGGSFPLRAIGRAHGAGETEGFVKVLGHAETDRILGVHVFGAQASELIAEAVVAMAFSGATEDLARITHAHPTLSEAIREAALAVDGRAIHA